MSAGNRQEWFPVYRISESALIMRCRGFTLTETLIAILLSALVVGMCTVVLNQAFVSQRQLQQLAQLQQNSHFMLSLLHNELENAAFWAGYSQMQLAASASFPAAPVTDCRQNGMDSGSFPVPALPFITLYAVSASSGRLLNCVTDAQSGSDILQIKRLAGQLLKPEQRRTNRYYLQLQWPEPRFVSSSEALATESWLYPYLHQLFYVQRQQTTDGVVPVLMRKRLSRNQSGQPTITTESVLDGVERLYFEFAIDSDLDGQLNYFLATPAMTAEHWQQQHYWIIGIRFYVLLRATLPDPHYRNNQQYRLGSRTFQAPDDHYRRMVLSSSVAFMTTRSSHHD